MFYRALVVGIIVFWGWTTVSLLRMETWPQGENAMPIPTAYVWKLMFLHEEASDLGIYNRRQRVGSLHLQPHRASTGGNPGVHLLTGYGNFSVDLPYVSRQNVVVHGSVELNDQNAVGRLKMIAVLREPKQAEGGVTIEIDGSAATGQWRYSVHQNGELLREGAGTIANFLAAPELRGLPFDPQNLARMGQEQGSRLAVSTQRGKLSINGEDTDTFVVKCGDGNGLESTIDVNSLGQVLAVKTSFGLALLDGALNP